MDHNKDDVKDRMKNERCSKLWEDIKTPYPSCLHPEWDFERDKQELLQRTSRIAKEKREMARTKEVQRKNTQSMTRVTHASTTVQSLPLPNEIKEEGELLYHQYFMLYAMLPELRVHLKQALNWTDKQITAHMKYMTKQWRHQKDEYKRSMGFQ